MAVRCDAVWLLEDQSVTLNLCWISFRLAALSCQSWLYFCHSRGIMSRIDYHKEFSFFMLQTLGGFSRALLCADVQKNPPMSQVEIHMHGLESETMCFRSALHNLNSSLLLCPLNIKFAQNCDHILTGLAATENSSLTPVLHQY